MNPNQFVRLQITGVLLNCSRRGVHATKCFRLSFKGYTFYLFFYKGTQIIWKSHHDTIWLPLPLLYISSYSFNMHILCFWDFLRMISRKLVLKFRVPPTCDTTQQTKPNQNITNSKNQNRSQICGIFLQSSVIIACNVIHGRNVNNS